MKKYLYIIIVVLAIAASQIACSDTSGPTGTYDSKYRGQVGDLLGIADKIECPRGDCEN